MATDKLTTDQWLMVHHAKYLQAIAAPTHPDAIRRATLLAKLITNRVRREAAGN